MISGSPALIDGVPTQSFEDVARLAAELCGTTHAVLCLVRDGGMHLHACYSRATDRLHLDDTACAGLIDYDGVLVVLDLQQDPQLSRSLITAGDVQPRFYAAVPLRTARGAVLGSLCVLDPEPRSSGLTSAQQACLVSLGRQTLTLLEIRHAAQQHRSQQSADEAALHKLQDQLHLAVAATDLGIFDYDLITGDLVWDARVHALFGMPPDAPVTYDTFLTRLHPDDRTFVDQAVKAALDPAGDGTYDVAYRAIGLMDGVERWIAAKGQAFFAQGQATRFIGTVRDISDVKRTEEHQRLLTGELQHRIKNTLAMVQAIANQTLRSATDLDEAREAFAGRLISLGRAHDILTQVSWTAAPIGEVIEGALGVHRQTSVPRIRISGPNVLLAAKPALSLALALHELATNAAKYGALSNESGTVDLRWHVAHAGDEPRFCLTWSEQGGPPILSPPVQRGFGSRLIERSFAPESGGVVTLTYPPTGLVCRIEAPLASMQEQVGVAAA
jgi:PAS domain S-box-containing protein